MSDDPARLALEGIPCTWMRGGTSKGAYFLASDLPADPARRDALLLSVMGSPDARQIDGIGGGDPLTSKVAVVGPPTRADADVDYLFLQVFVDRPLVSAAQNCGNILAGVAQFAVEKGLVAAPPEGSEIRVHMVNSAQVARIGIEILAGRPCYDGTAEIDGVPRRAAAVWQDFPEAAGSSCGALLPTGRAVDVIEGIACTLIDNGMPVVVMAAADLGVTGAESPAELEANAALRARIEAIRLAAGPMMNLGDVTDSSVPKLSLIAPPRAGGAILTRTFIPHRCHASIGVLGAVSVATACLLPEGPAHDMARLPEPDTRGERRVAVEHPSGAADVLMRSETGPDGLPRVRRAASLRTARKLFEGRVFPRADWAEERAEG